MKEQQREEVRAIAASATAHNDGQTVLGVSPGPGVVGPVVVHMSSWPRAQEALKALERRGFWAHHIGDAGVQVHPKGA